MIFMLSHHHIKDFRIKSCYLLIQKNRCPSPASQACRAAGSSNPRPAPAGPWQGPCGRTLPRRATWIRSSRPCRWQNPAALASAPAVLDHRSAGDPAHARSDVDQIVTLPPCSQSAARARSGGIPPFTVCAVFCFPLAIDQFAVYPRARYCPSSPQAQQRPYAGAVDNCPTWHRPSCVVWRRTRNQPRPNRLLFNRESR